ncbi:MAG TPA: PEP-CTERM sorting domain-containing protein [Candidatus Paceibacterota bacterium]|nr:PEP-CTERM sorting domain-containing protein [Candidatus Paceibacterota bacterium]
MGGRNSGATKLALVMHKTRRKVCDIKIKVANVVKFGSIKSLMKMLFAAGIIWVSAVSLWAQGHLALAGSEVLQRYVNPNLIDAYELPLSSTLMPPDWMPPSQRSAATFSDVTLIETPPQTALIDTPVNPILPPTPAGSTLSSQSVSFAVQPVPEPSAIALAGLAFGLIAVAGIVRRKSDCHR